MKTRYSLWSLCCLPVLLGLSCELHAAITRVTVTPVQRAVSAAADTVISVRWRVVTDGSSTLVESPRAEFINPKTGAVLSVTSGLLTNTGSGPFQYPENFVIDTATVRGWLNQGLTQVLLRREFSRTPTSSASSAFIKLSFSQSSLLSVRSSTEALAVHGLGLEFDNGNYSTLAELESRLQARLTVSFSGAGILDGRWQVAEPGSTEGVPLFRTLALVRQNLTGRQRAVLVSPELPTRRPGKYLVRFCVNNRELMADADTTGGQCNIENLVVTATYHVQGGEDSALGSVLGLSPGQGPVDADTVFSWQMVAGAQIYQMQIFELQAATAELASSREQPQVTTPVFVVGMVLPGAVTSTPMTDFIRTHLQPGKRYLWRITAHDASGRLIAGSEESGFVFQP